jgi:choline dehydrogenase-like flavoprotein
MNEFITTSSSSVPARAGRRRPTQLARAGRRVLLLEKGRELPRDGSTLDVDKVIRQGIFKSKEHWLDKNGRTFEPEEYFNLGGKTKWYGAALARFEPHEFEAEPVHQCLPWPISYRELLPYYEQAETLLGVHQFEPEPDLRAIVGKLTRDGGGWSARPLALALDSRIVEHPEEAAHFDAFASVKNLKADSQHALLERVQHLPNLTVLTGQSGSRFHRRPRPARAIAWRSYRGGRRIPGRYGVAGGWRAALATVVAGLSGNRQRSGRAAAMRRTRWGAITNPTCSAPCWRFPRPPRPICCGKPCYC